MAHIIACLVVYTMGVGVGIFISRREDKTAEDKAWFAETERLRRELCETKTRLNVVEPLVKELLSDKA